MKLRHLLAAAVVMTTLSSTCYGFMAEGGSLDSNNDSLATLVTGLQTDIKEGKVECSVILGRINTAVEAIDARLDAGVADETEYLATRVSLLEMRADLPCLSEELTKADLGESILSDTVVAEQTIGSEVVGAPTGAPMLDGTFVDGGMIGGGMSGGAVGGGMIMGGGGGAAGGGMLGGGGIGGIGMLGAIGAAVAIPLATDDDNNPGNVVSPSSSN